MHDEETGMTPFPLLDPAHTAPVSDASEEIGRDELARRVQSVKERIRDEGLAGARLCLVLDAGLGSMAALIAVLEMGARAAMILKPGPKEQPEWPAFCDAVLLPPEAGAPIDDMQVLRQDAGEDPGLGDVGRIWLRSSGTTGTPKWVMHETGSYYRNARAMEARLKLAAEDRVMIPVPINHGYGLGAAFIPSVQAGAAIRLVARGNPLMIFQAQRSFEPTVMYLVPSQCRSIMALGRKAGRARLIVVAGDRLTAEEAAAFEADHGQLVNHYGSTELGAVTAGVPDGPAELRHLTAGPPMDGVRLAIEHQAQPDPAAEGAEPMRLIHPAALMGYTDPATGALVTHAPEVWSTGDLVRVHEDSDGGSWVEVMGRFDHAVKRDGLLVHLGQIEGSLSRAKGVALSAVAPVGQSRRGIGLSAFVTLSRPGAATIEEMLSHCRNDLPPRAVPDHLHILDEMPMLSSGKVDRRRLSEIAREKLADAEAGA